MSRAYDLEDRLIRFGAATCRLCANLPQSTVGKVVTLQLVRCSTSPFANYGELQGAESRRDFIHKLSVCLKELREARAWLKFLAEMELSGQSDLEAVTAECKELVAIMATSVRTAQRNQNME